MIAISYLRQPSANARQIPAGIRSDRREQAESASRASFAESSLQDRMAFA